MEEGDLSVISDKAPIFRLFIQAVFVVCKRLPHAMWLCSLEKCYRPTV